MAREPDRPHHSDSLCLPLAASLYVISSAVWLLPDNAGWWGVLGLMLYRLAAARGLDDVRARRPRAAAPGVRQAGARVGRGAAS